VKIPDSPRNTARVDTADDVEDRSNGKYPGQRPSLASRSRRSVGPIPLTSVEAEDEIVGNGADGEEDEK
jgi:hypothetical protein